ncbi:MAG: hypothetical protein ACR2IE_20720 [Candidatus Sumerlaeaceae bacterium]
MRLNLILATMAFGVFATFSMGQPTIPVEQPESDPGTTGSEFGRAIGVSAKRVYIGAPKFNTASRLDAGRVFMFDTVTMLPLGAINSAPGAGAYLGSSLSASKTVALAGAPGLKVGSVFNAGGVLVYTEKLDSVTTISNPEPASGDKFGAAVAAGTKLYVIGAPGDFGAPGQQGGSAFVVPRTTLVPQRLPLPPDYASGDSVGHAVAVSSKFIAVGAFEKNRGSMLYSGAVHIYDAKTLAYNSTVLDPDFLEGSGGSRFGSAVSFSGKYLFVGAQSQNFGFPTPAFQSGAGAIYQYDTKTWTLLRRIDSHVPSSFANFGAELGVDKKRLYICAPTYDHAGNADGKVEVVDQKTGAFVNELFSPVPVSAGFLGSSIGVLKRNRFISGARGELGSSGQGTGRAYLHLVP